MLQDWAMETEEAGKELVRRDENNVIIGRQKTIPAPLTPISCDLTGV